MEFAPSPDWHRLAACSGAQAVMFTHSRESEAKRLCKTCPVASSCLAAALVGNERDGVWGGKTTDERDALIVMLRRRLVRTSPHLSARRAV